MEKLQLTKEPRLPSIEHLDSKLTKLLDPKITKADWKTYWGTPNFSELFPNMIFRVTSLDGCGQYTEEQKQGMFTLGFTSFMELPWTAGRVGPPGKMLKVNGETQLWEGAASRTEERGKESLVRVEIGCLLLLGLNLKDKEYATNLIVASYNSLKQTNQISSKQVSFRTHIIRLITTRNPFRQWVRENNLDRSNGFEWDSQITDLALRLLPQHKFPVEFKDLKNYPPRVIVKFVDYILGIATGKITNSMRFKINILQQDLAERLTSDDFNEDPASYVQLQHNLKALKSLIGQ